MTPIPCFWTAPNGRAQIALRRYDSGAKRDCPIPNTWGHNASVVIGEGACELRPWRPDDPRLVWKAVDFSDDPRDYGDDGRWPTACACGYTFTDKDERQVSWHPFYVGSPDGIAHSMRELPVGAVYRADWYEEGAAPFAGADPEKDWFRLGPDGMILEVVTPANGDCMGTTTWCVDQRSSPPRGFWTRNAIATDLKPGDPVPLHCNPSIFQFAPVGFHGWLHNGVIRSVA